MYDVIVVGARCAGSPLARKLAKYGHTVLLADRATFPSDTLSTHFVAPDAPQRLDGWDLLDRVLETGCPSGSCDLNFGVAKIPMPTGRYAPIAPRRTVLDKILLDAASEAGAEVREDFNVSGLLFEDGVVKGVTGVDAGGREVMEEAAIVVGADGRHSHVARWVNALEYNATENPTCGYYSYFSGMETPGHEVHVRDGKGLFVFATSDGLACLAFEAPKSRFHEIREDPEGSLRKAFDTIPGLGKRVQKARREERMMGSASHKTAFRQTYGPGWALAGDAGYEKDRVTGQGINDAFRDADSLADALDAGLTGRQPMAEALEGYAKQRDVELMPGAMVINMVAAELDPPPQLAMMMAASRAEMLDSFR